MIHAPTDTMLIDVEYLGRSRYIACALLAGESPVIVDPGPTVSLPVLEKGLRRAGLSIDDLAGILLTHIHLDHAGATGTIVRRNPRITVYVHRRGARHMADPERLLRSAGRLYGDRMDELWGDFLGVPEDNIRALSGGETLSVADRRVEVAYTPGHASHHVSYLDTSNGTAFVGDTAGIRVSDHTFVLPVTPPPDVDLEAWEASLGKIEAWKPERLFVTHFGPAHGVTAHLEQFRRGLAEWAEIVRSDLATGADEQACIETFTEKVLGRLTSELAPDDVPLYQQGGAPAMSWHGLARYWTKKSEVVS
jgi:glyoxylase-like metal-dependent hydrolase (beta-lactamase superfamily II)